LIHLIKRNSNGLTWADKDDVGMNPVSLFTLDSDVKITHLATFGYDKYRQKDDLAT